jgi:hypothetical protein
MLRLFTVAALAIALTAGSSQAAATITGNYIEVRNCDVWTGPCFAQAEGNLTGKNAVLVWQVDAGTIDDVSLDGLCVIAVVQASDTLGTQQTAPAKAIVIVDSRATKAQQAALLKLARQQGGALLDDVVAVQTSTIKVNVCDCKGHSCADVDAGVVKIKTRCLDEKHDKHCGNETAFYPPLTSGVRCVPAAAEHEFTGTGLSQSWQEHDRRGAYVGTFAAR